MRYTRVARHPPIVNVAGSSRKVKSLFSSGAPPPRIAYTYAVRLVRCGELDLTAVSLKALMEETGAAE